MQKLKIMNSHEKKEVMDILRKQWGAELGQEIVFLYSEKKHKVYIIARDIENIDLETLHIDSLGLYFGELMEQKEGVAGRELRLSIEGSQIVGPLASKNIVDIDDASAREWIRGQNVFNRAGAEGWVISRRGADLMGCGRVNEKVILNYVPKPRRIKNPAASCGLC